MATHTARLHVALDDEATVAAVAAYAERLQATTRRYNDAVRHAGEAVAAAHETSYALLLHDVRDALGTRPAAAAQDRPATCETCRYWRDRNGEVGACERVKPYAMNGHNRAPWIAGHAGQGIQTLMTPHGFSCSEYQARDAG